MYTASFPSFLLSKFERADFMELGKDVPEETVDTRLAGIMPGHCSTLIYTSGRRKNLCSTFFYPFFWFVVLVRFDEQSAIRKIDDT
jgi:hypothetical protein